jgi:tRNA threonylcarbamoyladenosine biosynthesis protein TsaB
VLLLAFDTATPAITVALRDGSGVRATVTTVDARRQGELLVPHISACLASAGASVGDLTDLVVGVGPGPFTGLRVGLVTARVMGQALGLPVRGVCTLDALAAQAAANHTLSLDNGFIVTTDARRREVHWAAYAVVDGRVERVGDPDVAAPVDVPVEGRPVVGRGADLYPDVLGPRVGPADPSAEWLAAYAWDRLARGVELLPPDPLYLRRPDAVAPGPPKRVRA